MRTRDPVTSLLSEPWSGPQRPLYIALAHCLATAKVGDMKRQALLNRLFDSLPWAQQFACRVELVRCKRAQRGQGPAVVS